MSRWSTFTALYDALCTENCARCGYFGGYQSLMSCERLCFLCSMTRPEYQLLKREDVISKFQLDGEIVDTLQPRMQVAPGSYGPMETKVTERVLLFDYASAKHKALEIHGSKWVKENVTEEQRSLLDFDPCLTSMVERRGDHSRYAAMVRGPYLDKRSNQVDEGFYCKGCKCSVGEPDPRRHNRHMYSKLNLSSFRDHMREFENSYGSLDGKGSPPP
ncbi:hypothetical protein F5Y16DRAFT_14729 [Xylariaceae sp. FL0255]|nr:hypothetical protein F5Y16DRAFT_14729 [Xylariaceae sp. FL0255]